MVTFLSAYLETIHFKDSDQLGVADWDNLLLWHSPLPITLLVLLRLVYEQPIFED